MLPQVVETEIPGHGNFASRRADLPPQKVKNFHVEIARLHDQGTPSWPRRRVQLENVFDFEKFINLEHSQGSVKLRHCSD